ncbi:MAG: GEVED domain-containing protein, partial [bacterium]
MDAAGAFSLDMDIANNDGNENPYDIAVSGTGIGSEIDVQRPAGAGNSIADGGTDNVGNQGVGVVNLTYTIDNTSGTAQLTVTGATASNYVNSSGFSVVTAMPLNVAAGATGTLQVSLNTLTNGAFSFDMDIANNDGNENPYDIKVSGTVTDADGDGIVDSIDNPTGDRDGDGTLNHLDYDPSGWIYNENTGEIITGGTISVSPPAGVTITQTGSSGYYQFFVSLPGIYTLSYTPPAGYNLSTTRPAQAGALDPTGGPGPYAVGLGSKDGATNKLTDWTQANNPYYWQFDLVLTDPTVINNNIPIFGTDYGDAPDPNYPTLLANNGARHTTGALFLGSLVDADANGQPNATATGDDTDGTDDEDGVVFSTEIRQGAQTTVQVTASQAGKLDAWIDFNGDGDWDDASEKVFNNQAVAAGANNLNFMTPITDKTAAVTSFVRFRLSSAGGLAYTGPAADGEVEDYPVTIKPVTIRIKAPNGYESYMGGSQIKVEWVSDPKGLSTVTLKYSTDDGATYPDLVASRTVNDGCYEWTAPTIHSNRVRVKAEVDGWPMAVDASDEPFAIDSELPKVELFTPNGVEAWSAGATHIITWKATDSFGLTYKPIRLRYSTDGGKTFPFIIAWQEDNDGSYEWQLPADLNSDSVRVKIKAIDSAGNEACDESDADFFVHKSQLRLTTPNGGEVLRGGSKHTIRWVSDLGAGRVRIQYSLNGGETYVQNIADGEDNDGEHVWTVPELNTQTLRIRIGVKTSVVVEDASDADVVVDSKPPSVAVQTPNGGEIIDAGGAYRITWTALDGIGLADNPITLSVSTDGGATYPNTIATAEANDGAYDWKVQGGTNSTQVRVRVTVVDRAGFESSDDSDKDLSVRPATASMASPESGEVLRGGAEHVITWNSNQTNQTVTLQYS